MSVTASTTDSKAVDLENQATITHRERTAPHHVRQRVANAAPLGLLAFATSIFVISLFGLQPRGVTVPNVIVPILVFFGGCAQVVAGIMEYISGHTLKATLFSTYASFNLAYAMIYLPGSGILLAYTDETGTLIPDFEQALAMFCWAWFIVSMIFTVATVRASWVILTTLVFVDLTLLLLAVGYMVGQVSVLKAGSATGLVTAFLAYWLAAAELWGDGMTPFNLPVGPLKKE
ncbi:GPR1/FUN34/yaaH family-domain-containing protein [Hypoxylon crocopeplum]|nr:GPR1/FUN34/yaaH family-domain-containing protein [Hypoxylon crocopeplum]